MHKPFAYSRKKKHVLHMVDAYLLIAGGDESVLGLLVNGGSSAALPCKSPDRAEAPAACLHRR
jgi:hypothetical protein